MDISAKITEATYVVNQYTGSIFQSVNESKGGLH